MYKRQPIPSPARKELPPAAAIISRPRPCLLYTSIISFDPRDAADNGLTVDRAQALGLAYCKEHFPGHQAIICTHPDGHNHSGNIHVHIVINLSLIHI